MAYVVDAVFQHCDAFRAHAKGEPGVFPGVVAHALQDLGMDHSGAQNLDPSAVPADTATVAVAVTGKTVDGQVDAGLHEGEVVTAEAYLAFLAEHLAGEFVQGALEVGKSDALANGQTLHLVEMPFVGGVGGLVPVALTRHHNPDGRFPALHDPGLHRRGVGPQEHGFLARRVFIVHPKGIPHVPGRVALGNVQHLEVVMVPLDLRAFDNAETHGHKDVAYLPNDLGGGVEPARQGRAARKGDIQPVPAGGALQRIFVDVADPVFQPVFQRDLGLVCPCANGPALLNLQGRQAAKDGGQTAPAAQVGDAPLVYGFQVFQGFQLRQGGADNFIDALRRRRLG